MATWVWEWQKPLIFWSSSTVQHLRMVLLSLPPNRSLLLPCCHSWVYETEEAQTELHIMETAVVPTGQEAVCTPGQTLGSSVTMAQCFMYVLVTWMQNVHAYGDQQAVEQWNSCKLVTTQWALYCLYTYIYRVFKITWGTASWSYAVRACVCVCVRVCVRTCMSARMCMCGEEGQRCHVTWWCLKAKFI
jgi:hypothetical protein